MPKASKKTSPEPVGAIKETWTLGDNTNTQRKYTELADKYSIWVYKNKEDVWGK